MNKYKSTQNRYCCVPLCNQKGSKGPNGEKVGFFNIPTDKYLREQWLHAIRRDTGKHFTNTNSTKVYYLHFNPIQTGLFFASQDRGGGGGGGGGSGGPTPVTLDLQPLIV